MTVLHSTDVQVPEKCFHHTFVMFLRMDACSKPPDEGVKTFQLQLRAFSKSSCFHQHNNNGRVAAADVEVFGLVTCVQCLYCTLGGWAAVDDPRWLRLKAGLQPDQVAGSSRGRDRGRHAAVSIPTHTLGQLAVAN